MAGALIACNTEKKIRKKTGTIEIFDISDFNRHKNKFGVYIVQKDDEIEIARMWDNYNKEYSEIVTYKKKYYELTRNFYPSGIIKNQGKTYYPGNGFQIGIWEYFDSIGRLTRTEDFDKKYKISYKQALDTVRIYYGFHQRDLSVEINGRLWYLENIKGNKKGQAALVSQKNGMHEKILVTRH